MGHLGQLSAEHHARIGACNAALELIERESGSDDSSALRAIHSHLGAMGAWPPSGSPMDQATRGEHLHLLVIVQTERDALATGEHGAGLSRLERRILQRRDHVGAMPNPRPYSLPSPE